MTATIFEFHSIVCVSFSFPRGVRNYCLFVFFFFLFLSLLLLVYSLFVVLGVDVRLPDPEFVFYWFESGR